MDLFLGIEALSASFVYKLPFCSPGDLPVSPLNSFNSSIYTQKGCSSFIFTAPAIFSSPLLAFLLQLLILLHFAIFSSGICSLYFITFVRVFLILYYLGHILCYLR